MKRNFFWAFSILSILLASCAFNEKSSGKSSLSFSIPQETLVKIAEKRHVISPSLNYPPPRIYKNEVNNQTEETETLKITAELTGSSSGTQTKNSSADFESIYKTSDISFTFSDLDTSDTYKITVNVYDSYFGEDYLIYSGTKENIILNSNEPTTVSLTLKSADADTLGTSIILYNKGDEPVNHALYRFDTDFLTSGKKTAPTATYSEGKTFTDFFIDSTDKIYHTDGEKIYCEDSEIADVSTVTDAGQQVEVRNLKIFRDDSGIIFYGGQAAQDYNFIFNSYDDSFNVTATAQECVREYMISWFDFATSLGEPVTSEEGEKITVTYNGYIYLSGMTSNSSDNKYKYGNILFFKIPIKYIIEDFGNGDCTGSLELSESEEKIINLAESSPVFSATISDNANISDITIQSGKLYALLNEVYFDKYGQQVEDGARFTNYSRGALITIELTDFSKAGAFADPSIVQGRDFTALASDTISEGETATTECAFFTVYQPDEGKYFFGAQKFLAIKPKKLVFSGDGYYFYTDEDGHFCFKNINEVYVYDERKQAATAYTLSTTIPIQFDGDKTSDFDFDCAGTAGFELETKAYYKE